MKLIPLNTKFKYFCSEDGRIFREQTELKGWKHTERRSGNQYLRYGLWIKYYSGWKRKFFFGQRLVAMCYHNLLDNPKRIVRHLTADRFNNAAHAILPGTHEENQTIDRIEQGTYMNRGGLELMTTRFRFDTIIVLCLQCN